MFGWFRKRDRAASKAGAERVPAATEQLAVEPVEHIEQHPEPVGETQPAQQPVTDDSLRHVASTQLEVATAPSLRPAMPLSARPNYAGLGLAVPDAEPPRLLEPVAALSPEARENLTALLTDMFGATGRYRLEWRVNREAGDDAMFSEIMVADLVRRIQNTIAGAESEEDPALIAARKKAIAALLQREESLEDKIRSVMPELEAADTGEDEINERRIA